jgi:hypothetical protein
MSADSVTELALSQIQITKVISFLSFVSTSTVCQHPVRVSSISRVGFLLSFIAQMAQKTRSCQPDRFGERLHPFDHAKTDLESVLKIYDYLLTLNLEVNFTCIHSWELRLTTSP